MHSIHTSISLPWFVSPAYLATLAELERIAARPSVKK